MSKYLRYKSPLGVLGAWIQRTGHTPDERLNETDILSFIHMGMGKLMSTPLWDEKIVVLPVKNYYAELQDDFRAIIQAGYKIDCEDHPNFSYRVTEYVQKGLEDCDIKISLSCPKCKKVECGCKSPTVVVDADRIWRAQNPHFEARLMDHYYGYHYIGNGFYSTGYHPEFRLMRAKQNNFHVLKYHVKDCINLITDCEVEYALNDGKIIVPFQDGQILLSYLGERLDEEGYRLIPDNPWVIDYLVHYIEEKMAYIEGRSTKDWSFYAIAKNNAETAFYRAKGKLSIPEYTRFRQFWKNKMNKILAHGYQDNFNNLNRFLPDRYRLPLEDDAMSINTGSYEVHNSEYLF